MRLWISDRLKSIIAKAVQMGARLSPSESPENTSIRVGFTALFIYLLCGGVGGRASGRSRVLKTLA